MFRNDTLAPFLALVASVPLAFATWATRRRAAEITGQLPPSLTSVQIALLALSALLVIYGCVGLLSVWLEGRMLRPGVRSPTAAVAALAIGIVSSVAIVVLAAFLVAAVRSDLRGEHVAPVREGAILAAISLLCAIVLTVYRKYFMQEEALVEEEDSEVPW
jgi:hypothetical protein